MRLEAPELRPDIVPVLNAFYRRRMPLDLTVAGEALTVAAGGDPVGFAGDASAVIRFEIGGVDGALECPARLVDDVLASFGPETDPGALVPEHVALLLECALAEDLGALEAQLDCGIEIISVERSPERRTEPSPLILTVGWRGESLACGLHLDDASALRLAGLLDERQTRRPPLRMDIPAPVSIWKAVATMSLGELQSAAPGDVVVLDATPAGDQSALIVMADRLLARAKLNGNGCTAVSRPFPIRGSNWEWIMNQAAQPDTEKLEDSGFDALPVTVAFELGRKAMPLSEISALAPGAVVQLAGMSAEAVSILAQGKRIGEGEIVRIGEALGVRIVRIFDNA
ncbi:type III secretion system cytoplasmic ring protein SctQ [Nitratireductor sp. ZSWI3]|uniref:type III secretion system cytoplasmic ring protein SctQ n=1 Tax=Nitratireductor sp. ZSWI3 TaxID=2966359 RepID=UPI00215032E4|nr:type III secretion system cytoplasmic ring protein SctQ [Nitratireductor sp. ZSWI3]MCR4264833.1 type III secretion system cytoplasmic ring protein SctQ [Nitratireductor sp. ZSWI3]